MALRFGVAPMRAVSGQLPPDDDNWGYEIKWDGYRTLAFVTGGSLRLQSANLLDVTAKYPELAALPAATDGDAVLDGEIVALDSNGRPDFGSIQRHEVPVTFMAFDVLATGGQEVTARPYEERKALLAEALTPGPHWLVPGYHVGGGRDLLDAAVAQRLEGIMAKRLGTPYVIGKRSQSWRKIKERRRQELVVGGYTTGTGNRSNTFGALLVGVYEGDALRFAGGVGTGYDQRWLDTLLRELRRLETKECPFDPPPPRQVQRTARWVHPELVCEVAFAEWTSDDIIRQSSFMGLREDKDPRAVVREP
jgi:bifunctional non-homologous end joining protein LigD